MTLKKSFVFLGIVLGLFIFTGCIEAPFSGGYVANKTPTIELQISQDEFNSVIPYVTGGVVTAKVENSEATEVEFTSTNKNIRLEQNVVSITNGIAQCSFTVVGNCTNGSISASIPYKKKSSIKSAIKVKASIASVSAGGVTFGAITADEHSIPLTWTNDKEYSLFVINYSWQQPGTSISVSKSICVRDNITEYELTGLYGNTTYLVDVLGISNNEYTKSSDTFSTGADTSAPLPVTNIGATPDEYYIDLTWNNSPSIDVAKIVIDVASSISETIPSVTLVPPVGSTFFGANDAMVQRISGLSTNNSDGVSYTFTVKVYDDSNNHDAANDRTFTCSTKPDSTAPGNVSAVIFDFTSGTIKWDNPEDVDYKVVHITNGASTVDVAKASTETTSVSFAKGDEVSFVTEDNLGNKSTALSITIPTGFATINTLSAGASKQLVAKLDCTEDASFEYYYRLTSGSKEGTWRKSKKICLNNLTVGTPASVYAWTKAESSLVTFIYKDSTAQSGTPEEPLVRLVCEHGSSDAANPCYMVSAYGKDSDHAGCFFVNKNSDLFATYKPEALYYIRPGILDPEDPDAISYESYRSTGRYLAIDSGRVHTNETSGSPVGGFDGNNNASLIVLTNAVTSKIQKENASFSVIEAYNGAAGYFSIVQYNTLAYMRKWWDQCCTVSTTAQFNDTPSCMSWKYETVSEPGIPDAISNVTLKSIDHITANFTWSDPADVSSLYKIVITADETDLDGNPIIKKIDAGVKRVQITNLKKETAYNFTFTAINAYDKSKTPVVKAVTTTKQQPAVKNVKANTLYTGSMVVSWTDSTFEDDENIGPYTYKVICNETGDYVEVAAGVEKGMISGLTVGSNYTFKVETYGNTSTQTNVKLATSSDTSSVQANKLVWKKVIGGYEDRLIMCNILKYPYSDCISDYGVIAEKSDQAATIDGNHATIKKDDMRFQSWIVYPSLTKPNDPDYISLMASSSGGVETGYYLYSDDTRPMSDKANMRWWGGKDLAIVNSWTPKLFVAKTSETYLNTADKQKMASFKKVASSSGGDWFNLQCEGNEKYVQHSYCVYTLVDSINDLPCANLKVTDTKVLTADEYNATPKDVTNTGYTAGVNSITLKWTPFDEKAFEGVIISTTGLDKDSNAIADVKLDGIKSGIAATTYTFDNLASDTEYTFNIKTYNFYGLENTGVNVVASTDAVPTEPKATNVAVKATHTGAALVTWKDTILAGTYTYKVTATPSGGSPVVKDTIAAGTQKAFFTGLDVGTEYTFVITTVDESSTEYDSESKTLTPKQFLVYLKNGPGTAYGGGDGYLMNCLEASPSSDCSVISILGDLPSNCAVVEYKWIVMPGLADPDNENSYSFKSSITGHEDYYLRFNSADLSRAPSGSDHPFGWAGVPSSNILFLHQDDGTTTFDSDATFIGVTTGALDGYMLLKWYDETTAGSALYIYTEGNQHMDGVTSISDQNRGSWKFEDVE